MSAQPHDLAPLRSMLKSLPIAMFNTVAHDGSVVSRPLQVLEFDDAGVLWFATGLDTDKAAEIRARPHIGLSFADHHANSFVSISGPARLVQDREKIDDLWTPAMSIFFPQGKDDPNLTLVRVEVERAEYWSGPGTFVGKLVYMAAAALTGDPGVMNENETIVPGAAA
ncbi:MAG: pyridoxamine 5'-phosphate oxidase family protein [Lysobacteraceae bacterium]